jgi:predicted metal-dependent phosphoesterase TrpH
MQKVFRYPAEGRWFKGNTHIHTLASDGGMSVRDMAALYARAEYDFVFCTDHWKASDVQQFEEVFPLLLMDGIELDGQDSRGEVYHIVCLGRARGVLIDRMDLSEAVGRMRDAGAITILAHPEWTGNSLDPELADRLDGVEIYNHVCRWLNGKWSGRLHWNTQLKLGRPVLGFAVDDAHLRPEHPGWNGGWIQVLASSCEREAILEAIRRGHFYASCGPVIQRLEERNGRVELDTTPVRQVRLVGPDALGQRQGSFDGVERTRWAFEVPPTWPYAYLEIEDALGRCAWTQTLYV